MKTQKLIITDPCYLLDGEEWAECCEVWGDDETETPAEFLKKIEEKLSQKANIRQVVGVAKSPDGDGAFFVEPLNGTKCREFEFWVDSGVWCVCVVNNFDVQPMNDGIAKIEIEMSGNLCIRRYQNMPKNRYYINSGSQNTAVIDFDAELDDDDNWEKDLPDDDDDCDLFAPPEF